MSITLFLVDDHVVVREGLRLLLQSEDDMEVVGEATNGRDAVRRVPQLRPDVAVVDITMPDLNGIDATRQMMQACPSLRVVILSMHSSTEYIFRALEAGAYAYVTKESAGVDLVSAVRAAHAGRRYLSSAVSDQVIEDYVCQRAAAGSVGPLDRLSAREREILQLVVEGKTNAEMAEILFLSPKTVETYRSRLMQKLGINDMAALVKFAILHGLTPLE